MDQTGSEESKQPAGEGAKPSEPSTGEHRAASEHSGQGESPESARRAFDLLERFSGELEEILHSLERARGGAAPSEESPPAPERAFRPSSIHFNSSPISTRIDPDALPPVESPGATSRTAPRLLLEALFLILVAAISAKTGLSPLLIVTAEAVAFLIVASIELAVAHERRRIQQFPAATPSFAAPEAQRAEATSSITAFTLEQVEPLVWQSELREAAAEADWPLAADELPSEAEDAEAAATAVEEAQEGATEIASERRPEVAAATAAAPELVPEAQSETDLEDAVPPPISGPEPEADLESTAEIPAPEVELEPEVAAEPEIEPEPESIPEVFAAEAEPERPRRFHPFRRTSETAADAAAELEGSLESGAEIPASETERELEAKTEVEPVGAEEPEAAPAGVSEPETEPEVVPERARRFHLFRRETSEPEIAEPEAEPELELEASEPEIEPEIETESAPEIFAVEAETAPEGVSEPEIEPEAEQTGHFHLFRRETSEPELAEAEREAELEPEVAAEPELEDEPEVVPESASEIFAIEAEAEPPRRFHLFRREASEPEVEPEPSLGSSTETEIPISASETEIAPKSAPERAPEAFLAEIEFETVTGSEVDSEVESLSEIATEEAEPEHRRFHLFRRETGEPEVAPEVAPEVSLESSAEIPASEAETESGAEIVPGFVVESETEPESVVEPEQPRHFHFFRRGERALEAEMELEPEAEPEAELTAEVEDLPEVAPEVAPEIEPEVFSIEAEPEQPRRFHLFRHEERALEAEMETEAKEEIEPAEMTIEIDLPPATALDEIERTLENIGHREPSLRRRRWSRGAEAEKAVAVQELEDETANGESEVRLTAERERRRREREYLRNLRVSR